MSAHTRSCFFSLLLCLCLYTIQLVSFMQYSWLCISPTCKFFFFVLRQSICFSNKCIFMHAFVSYCPLFAYNFCVWFIRAQMHTQWTSDAHAMPYKTHLFPVYFLLTHSLIFHFIRATIWSRCLACLSVKAMQCNALECQKKQQISTAMHMH